MNLQCTVLHLRDSSLESYSGEKETWNPSTGRADSISHFYQSPTGEITACSSGMHEPSVTTTFGPWVGACTWSTEVSKTLDLNIANVENLLGFCNTSIKLNCEFQSKWSRRAIETDPYRKQSNPALFVKLS